MATLDASMHECLPVMRGILKYFGSHLPMFHDATHTTRKPTIICGTSEVRYSVSRSSRAHLEWGKSQGLSRIAHLPSVTTSTDTFTVVRAARSAVQTLEGACGR